MKYDQDFSSFPETHWTEWNNEEFQFLRSHHLWEHPAVSQLAKKTRPTLWEFDCDADWVIHKFVRQFWVDGILARASEVDEELYYKAKEYDNISHFEILEYPDLLDEFVSMREAQGKNYEDIYDDRNHKEFSNIIKTTPLYRWKQIDFERKVKDPYMYRLMKEITYLIFTTGYNPRKDHINAVLKRHYKEGDEDDQQTYNLYFTDEDKYDGYEPIEPIDYKMIYHDDIYWLMILLYPAENLPSYLHDQMLYMNYIQDTVAHDQFPMQKEIVLKNSLLSNTPNKEDFKIALDYIGSYWT